ncbi:AraC family transcriptional regulator [Rhodobacteraceae bacterium S2214]|nr:AraC family transcriptional regulator [Rhodobacteraceae bacterium S2214]
MTHTMRQKSILADGQAVHLTRATVLPRRPKSLHTHDYVEMFWVQNGIIRHHAEDGVDTLSEGTLVVVPKGQTHALQGKGEHAMVVMLCLSTKLTNGIVKRHAPCANILQVPTIRTFSRDTRQLAALNQAAMRLERSPCDAFAAEAFLLPLLVDLLDAPEFTDAPAWLTKAYTDAQDPDVFRQGAAGFVALTGKAHPHVSRTMKHFSGLTPVQYINDLRMKHAARSLTGSSDPLSEIASEIGLPNLSHFHKLFRAKYGVTPAQYRADKQRHVVQPE